MRADGIDCRCQCRDRILPTKLELQQLAATRLEEAKALHAAGFNAGAFYLAGYVLELSLKACICKALNLIDYPEGDLPQTFKTHRTRDLVLLAGLRDSLDLQRRNMQFNIYWNVIETWKPEQRYQLNRSAADAAELIHAFTAPSTGVFEWLSNQW